MANTILIKRSSTASATPTALQLTAGELAVNTADGRLFTKNSAGAIVNLPVSSISGQAITPGQVNVDNIQLNDNTLSTTDLNGSLIVSPNGTGKILLGRTTADGTTNVVQCHSLTVRGTDAVGGGTTPSFTSTGATYFGNASGEVGLLCAIVPAETFDATHPTVYCFTGCNEPVTAYKPILFTAGYFAQFWLDPSGYVGIGTASPSATLDVAGTASVTGVLTVSAGTAADPALVFTGDTDTGIYSPGADQLAVATAGVARLTVNATGQVGIGTTSPGSKLEVIPGGGQGINCLNNGGAGTVNYAVMAQAAGAASANTGLYVNVTGATNNYGVRIVNPPAAANSYAIYSDAAAKSYFSGSVGIGTTTPSQKLDVVGSINVSSTLQLSGSTSGFVAFQSPAAPTSHTYTLPSVTGTSGQVLTTNGSGVLSWTAPTVRATITATANQTAFTVSGGYTVGGIDVYLNGIKQVNGDDFTATNGTSITLTQGADAGDILDYVAYGFAVTTGALVKSGDTMTGSLTMTAGTTFTMSGYTETTVAIGNSSTAQTLAITSGTQITCTLTGNCTFTMPTAAAGKSFTLLLKTGAGAFTATFTGVKWPNNSAPTITATAARMDIISFVADGTNWYGNIAQGYAP